MKVIGIRRFPYTSKRTGETYPACNLFCTETRRNVEGEACFDLFCRAELVPDVLMVGDEVHCSYNRFGSVESIEVVEA